MTATVRFERHDLRAVQMARRALLLFADAIDQAGGNRGAATGLALDDLTLLIDRMQEVLDQEKPVEGHVVQLDNWSRRT